jgi:hypothetical protein
MKNAVLIAIALLMVATAFGCMALSEVLTPAAIDKRAVTYAESAGVIDANDFDGYGNLLKAVRLKQAVEDAFEVNLLSIQQLADRNRLDYDLLKGSTTQNASISRAREEAIFGPEGLLTMGLGMLGAGGLAGAVGLMRKRPGDWSKVEVDKALADAGVQTDDRKRQLTEVVMGIEKVLRVHPKTDAVGQELRQALASQSPDTRLAVAEIKATQPG